MAGACARTVGAPLSRVTILQQTAATGSAYGGSMLQITRTIVQREGFRGLVRGNFPDVLRAAPQQGISFLAYENLKRLFMPLDPTESKVAARFGAGGCSGVLSILCTYPLDLVRTRLAATTKSKGTGTSPVAADGIIGQMRAVMRQDGFMGLYRGCGIACMEKFPNLACNFAIYDLSKKQLNACFGEAHPMAASLACGIFAGSVSNSITFPIDLVAKNVQLDGTGGRPKLYRGFMDCVRQILARGGFRGLYTGLITQLCKAVPVAATGFVAYESMRLRLGLHVVPESFRGAQISYRSGEA